jgi:hypothetical protein
METVEPKGLSEEQRSRLERLSAACDCTCSLNQYDGANGAGKNSKTCGCFCAHSNDSANKSDAKSTRAEVVLGGLIAYLQGYS